MKKCFREKKTSPELNSNQQKQFKVSVRIGLKKNNNLNTPTAERQYQNHML